MSSPATAPFAVEIRHIEALSAQVRRLVLQAQPPARARFAEGQFLSLMLADGSRRSYSYAGACRDDGTFELHVRLHAGGRFSTLLTQGTLRPGSRLEAIGPFGECVWQPATAADAPVLMLATGTGLAPLKALLEAQLPQPGAPLWLYWGGVSEQDLYLHDQLRALARRAPRFHYVPVLSQPSAHWPGERGFVQEIAMRDHRDLRAGTVYACGAPVMVRSALQQLCTHSGLDPARFHADPFEPSEPAPAPSRAAPVRIEVRRADGSRTALALAAGGSLMTALRAARLLIGVCGGQQSCGTCRIRLSADQFQRLPAPARSEQRLLRALPASGALDRLACQIALDAALDGLQLTIPGADG